MRKQCLFDPNHLIDELAYSKHLLNCQSKLKKDWRKCKFDDSHWHLYKHIDFHEKYECPSNPLYLENPQKFLEERQKQIIRRKAQIKQKDSTKVQSFLSQIQQDSDISQTKCLSFSKPPVQGINFGQISIIQRSQKQISGHQNFQKSKNQQIHNYSVRSLHNALNINESMFFSQEPSGLLSENLTKQKSLHSISKQEQSNFESGILTTQKSLWKQPDFESFQKRFRQTWTLNKSKMNKSENNLQQKKEESFAEQQQDQMSIQKTDSESSQIDKD